MTPYAFLVVFVTSAIAGLVRWPLVALGTYVLVFFAHPPSRWWGGYLPNLRWSLTAAACALIAAYFYKQPPEVDRNPWHRDAIIRYVVLFVAWMWIQTPWALSYDDHIYGVNILTKYILIMYVIIKLLDKPEALDFMCVAHIVGCAYFGVLAREMGSGSERLDGVGGPGVDDANTLGMMFATASVLGAVQVLSGPLWKRGLVALCMPFVLNGLVLTQSRGAFLGLAMGGIALFFLAPKGRRAWIGAMGAAGVVLFLALASENFWERMQTIQVEQGEEREKSAESRIVIAQAQLRMFVEHPMGSGHRGTAALSRQYIPEEYLTKNSQGQIDENSARSSHNTLLSVLVEQGIVGIVLYTLLILTVARRVLALRSAKDALPERAHISMLAAGIGGALTVIFVSGQFADYLRAEVLFWLLAMVVAATRVMGSYDRSVREQQGIQSQPGEPRTAAQSLIAASQRR